MQAAMVVGAVAAIIAIRHFGKAVKTRKAVKTLLSQMNEPRALPMGMSEFEEWSDRIIAEAMLPGATPESQKFALAEMIMHIKPTVDHESDAYFIKCLRKGAVNQIAWAKMEATRAAAKERLAKEDSLKVVP